jgi:hypothetical protein
MTEGKIYRCSWKRIPAGYRVWLKADPAVAAEHADFEAADELLYERIMEATGDGENQHQYVPPPPDPAGPIGRGRLWLLGREGGVTIDHELPYFDGGLCEECLMPLGPRTSLSLEVSALKGGVNAADVRFRRVAFGVGPRLTIVSERLLETFTELERAGFEWRPVTGASPRRAFFELVPKTPTTPYVLPEGPSLVAERCETCGFTWSPYYKGWFGPDNSVSEADLPHPPHTLIGVNQWTHAALAVTEARWRELVGQPSLKGVREALYPSLLRTRSGTRHSYRARGPSDRGEKRLTKST